MAGLALPVQRMAVGAVHDPMEAEAERVADAVVGVLRRRRATPEDTEVQRDVVPALRRRAAAQQPIGAEGGELSSAAEQQLRSASSGGSALPAALRGDLESALGSDLSRVRLHTGSQSTALNRSISAVAFTSGQDIHFRDGMPDTGTDSGLHLLAHELTHTIQQGGPVARTSADPAVGQISRFSDATIRRAPVPSFTALAPRAPGAPVPAAAARPPWLRGGHGEAATVRAEVAANVRSMPLPAPIEGDPAEAGYQCQLCGRWSVLEAMSVDHITDWREYCAPATDHQEFEARYHEVANLQLVHNNCNSSKNAADLFDWWRAQPGSQRLRAEVSQRIVRALERLFDAHGVDWISEVPEGQRQAVIAGIVRQSSGNAFEHLMGNGQIADAMGGWGVGLPEPETPDAEMTESDS